MSAEVLIGGGFKNFDLFFNAQRRLTRIFWLHGGGGFKNLIFLSPTAAAALGPSLISGGGWKVKKTLVL